MTRPKFPTTNCSSALAFSAASIFTQDIRFKTLAEQWQRDRRPFAGLIFGHQLAGTIGGFVRDLQLIAEASEPSEWTDIVEWIPF